MDFFYFRGIKYNIDLDILDNKTIAIKTGLAEEEIEALRKKESN
ncbi:hypothetical protein [Clostridium botulinum]|nr:hypothetical protein [Clostridium botulinum]